MEPDQRGSRTLLSAVLLSLCGGYLDAYTYFVRDGVFANAQTGNVIKFGISAAGGDFRKMVHYLLPILAFIAGVLFSLIIDREFEKHGQGHRIRRTVLAAEILLMIVISFLPQTETCNELANILVSMLCAMQMETFQIFDRKSIATTVATGNLRLGTEHLYRALKEHRTDSLKAAGEYFGLIGLFTAGVVFGALVSARFGVRSILLAAGLLAFAMMHITAVYRRVAEHS